MDQLKVTDAPAPVPAGALKPAVQGDTSAPDISVLLVGNRLQITADVDDAGLGKLQDVLEQVQRDFEDAAMTRPPTEAALTRERSDGGRGKPNGAVDSRDRSCFTFCLVAMGRVKAHGQNKSQRGGHRKRAVESSTREYGKPKNAVAGYPSQCGSPRTHCGGPGSAQSARLFGKSGRSRSQNRPLGISASSPSNLPQCRE